MERRLSSNGPPPPGRHFVDAGADHRSSCGAPHTYPYAHVLVAVSTPSPSTCSRCQSESRLLLSGDHPVPLDRPRRCALGRLRGEEQLDRPTERQLPSRIRCPQISRVRCPNHLVSSLLTRRGSRQVTRCWALPFDVRRILCSWLAREDSNLQSPDPESGALPFGHSPARERGQCYPPEVARLWTLAQVSFNVSVRLNASASGAESGSGVK